MFKVSTIEDNSIIICPSETKDELIKEINQNPLIRVKFFTKEEVLSNVYFTYDDNAIVYLMKKGYGFSNAKEILDNLYNIKEGTDKLNSLYNIYQELKENNLLKRNYLFKNLFNGKKVYIVDYYSYDEELKHALKLLKVDYEFSQNELGEYRPQIIEFKNMDLEVKNFFREVCKLKEKGVSLNDIFLYSYASEYDLVIKKYAKQYGLPIEFSCDMTLNESPVFSSFIERVNDGESFEDSFSKISVIDYEDYHAYQKLVNTLNDVLNINDDSIDKKEYLIEKAKKVKLKGISYEESIKIISSSYRGQGYIFILGFSLGSFPVISKDTDLLSDKEKIICNRNTSLINNKINFEKISNFITSKKNIYISRKLFEGKEAYYNSQITKKLNLETIEFVDDGIRYNRSLAEDEVSAYNDTFNDFGIDNEYINGIDKNEFDYLSYDHNFKPSELMKNNKDMTFSYTQINEYYKCPFMYFIKRLCVKSAFEDTFFTKLGSLFHKILEDSLKKEINLDDYQNVIDDKFNTAKEKFLINKLLPQVLLVIKKNQEFASFSDFTESYGEKSIVIDVDKKTRLQGYIDKYIVNEKNKEVIIIDYKTGNLYFNKDKVQYGLDLQLPTYSYLMKIQYPEYAQAGIYIQKICEESPDDENVFMLDGITIRNEELMRRLDKGIDSKSKFINKIGMKASGELKSNKSFISKDEFDALSLDAESLIKEAIKNIREGKFDINPVLLDGKEKESVCKDCVLGSVCFHEYRDYRKISLKKNKDDEDEEEDE